MRFEAISGGNTIRLIDTRSGTEAEIFAFGGLLNAFKIAVDNETINLVAGFSSVEDARKNITNGFRSAKLSPFVCRMKDGKYQHDGKVYQVKKHFLQAHAIHGLIFDAPYSIVDVQANDAFASVTLRYQYAATDPGYPFIYNIGISWKLEADNQLEVTTAVSNENAVDIPMADGWHPYFTLGGSVDEWTLQFSNSEQLDYDAALIPTGKKITNDHFTAGASLQGVELDNGFLFNDLAKANSCTISNEKLQLTVMPNESYPVLQLYIPPARKSIAIENLSGAPDNFNNQMNLVLLKPGATKQFTTRYIATVL